MQELKI